MFEPDKERPDESLYNTLYRGAEGTHDPLYGNLKIKEPATDAAPSIAQAISLSRSTHRAPAALYRFCFAGVGFVPEEIRQDRGPSHDQAGTFMRAFTPQSRPSAFSQMSFPGEKFVDFLDRGIGKLTGL